MRDRAQSGQTHRDWYRADLQAQEVFASLRSGDVPACEILQVNNAVRSMIRDNKNHQIDNAIASGSWDGMISMDQAIAKLYKEGRVSQEVALLYADKPEQLKRQL